MQSVQEHVDGFIFHCQYEKNLSDKTLKAYAIDLRQFLEFLNGNMANIQIVALDKQILREYIKALSSGKKPKTIKRKLATLKAFFSHLDFEGAIVANPFRKIKISIKEEKTLPRTIARPKISVLFGSLYSGHPTPPAGTSITARTMVRDIAVLELLYSAGVRVSELCNLRKENVDLQRGSIKIMGKGRRERVVPLCGEEDICALKKYSALYREEIEAAGWFFINRDGRRMSEQSVRFMIRKYVKQAHLEEHITPHMFRHSIATQLLENGVDIRYIQTFLGHSSITTTQIYAQVTEESQRQVIIGKHPRRDFGTKVTNAG